MIIAKRPRRYERSYRWAALSILVNDSTCGWEQGRCPTMGWGFSQLHDRACLGHDVSIRKPIPFASGHTLLNTPDPIRTRKLSSRRPGQYWGGGPPGKPLGAAGFCRCSSRQNCWPCRYDHLRNPPARQRPYSAEYTRSHSNSEVKQQKARPVLGWGTAREALGCCWLLPMLVSTKLLALPI